jgi:hypothetical protein
MRRIAADHVYRFPVPVAWVEAERQLYLRGYRLLLGDLDRPGVRTSSTRGGVCGGAGRCYSSSPAAGVGATGPVESRYEVEVVAEGICCSRVRFFLLTEDNLGPTRRRDLELERRLFRRVDRARYQTALDAVRAPRQSAAGGASPSVADPRAR